MFIECRQGKGVGGEREKPRDCLLYAPRPGMEPAPFWCTWRCSSQLSCLARAIFLFIIFLSQNHVCWLILELIISSSPVWIEYRGLWGHSLGGSRCQRRNPMRQFPGAVVTKHHKPGGVNNRNFKLKESAASSLQRAVRGNLSQASLLAPGVCPSVRGSIPSSCPLSLSLCLCPCIRNPLFMRTLGHIGLGA